jgi:hypothetical protein
MFRDVRDFGSGIEFWIGFADLFFLSERVGGAGCRDRTRDPVITNHVLYQLS